METPVVVGLTHLHHPTKTCFGQGAQPQKWVPISFFPVVILPYMPYKYGGFNGRMEENFLTTARACPLKSKVPNLASTSRPWSNDAGLE